MSCLTFLGLCLRAGHLEIGEESCGAAARAKKARAVLTASDLSHSSLSRAETLASAAGAPLLPLPFTKAELGMAVGRGTPGILAITDVGMASAFAGKLSSEYPGTYDESAQLLSVRAERAEKRRQEKRRQEKRRQEKRRRRKNRQTGGKG